jgi:hypothetical protein
MIARTPARHRTAPPAVSLHLAADGGHDPGRGSAAYLYVRDADGNLIRFGSPAEE